MSDLPFEVREKQGQDVWGKRWQIVNPTTGEILDDAQGYGYKTKQRALKAGWYKFADGKAKMDATTKAAEQFWRNHKSFAKKINELQETWFKEILMGEINLDEAAATLAKDLGVQGFHKKFLAHLK